MVSLFINWDVSPEIFNLGGFSIRYYGLLFALAFVCGYKVEEKMFKSEGLSQQWLDKLWIYVAVATVIGTLFLLRVGILSEPFIGNCFAISAQSV